MYFDDFKFGKNLLREVRPDPINKHDKVERYGYVPFAKRVVQMEQAGLNLLAIRAEMCDFKPDDAIDWSKDFSRLNDFDRFQQEEMAKSVADKFAKMQALYAEQAAIKKLTEQGYSVSRAEAEAKHSGADNDAKSADNPVDQSE